MAWHITLLCSQLSGSSPTPKIPLLQGFMMNLIHSNCINRSQISSSPVSIHGVPLPRRNKKKHSAVRVSNFAASSTEVVADNGRRSLTAPVDSKSRALTSGMSSSALEQLDIERGVCIPFRKYSPETVRWYYILLYTSNYIIIYSVRYFFSG